MTRITAYVRQGLNPVQSVPLTDEAIAEIQQKAMAGEGVQFSTDRGGEVLIGPGLVANTLFRFDPVNLETQEGGEASAETTDGDGGAAAVQATHI